jgi:hypothetical protein
MCRGRTEQEEGDTERRSSRIYMLLKVSGTSQNGLLRIILGARRKGMT